jgi:phosphoglycerol transferase MdoB-like AlkP superfamily enzyme
MKKVHTTWFRPLMFLGGIYMAISFGLRIVLWRSFGLPASVPWTELPLLLATGTVNDTVELLYLLAPLSLYLCLLPGRLGSRRWHRRVFALATFLVLFGMLYLAVTEYFFFEEFDSRFNLVAVDYLIYPTEVLVNIWNSYPVIPVLIADALASFLLLRLIWPSLRRSLERPPRPATRGKVFLAHGVLLGLAMACFSTTTLSPGDNRVANQLAANGVSSLFQAFRTNELNYDTFYRTMDQDHAFTLVRGRLAGEGGTLVSQDPNDLNRSFPKNPAGLGKMNVVVLVEESLGADYVGIYGGKKGLTPNFDRLAPEGLMFRNAFATGTRTVRGLEAITASFPPIPSESIIKRPGCEDVANWGKVMRDNGYATSFLYGGYGYFDNMNPFFQGLGFNISDRTDIPDPKFANIWGVSDEDLFGHAVDYFDHVGEKGRSFFSIIMSTSNHKPFTFPSGIPGIPAKGGKRKAGVRYADYAIGQFFQEAQSHPWFDNTLFVIVADHDARVYGRAQIPVDHYRIPLLFYAPGRLASGMVDTPISQMDIAPTVLGLLGLPYTAPFYGEDVLHAPPGQERGILINHNHDVGLLEGDRLTVLGLNKETRSFHYEPGQDRLDPVPADGNLVDLATAYYQTAFELFRAHRYR